jgi:diguanylate cyclase (GGDEF)-like protein
LSPVGSDRQPLESPVAAQLRRGYAWLRFFEPLESEFRRVHQDESAGRVRLNLWLALGLVLAFALLARIVAAATWTDHGFPIRYGVLVGMILLALAVERSRAYRNHFAPLIAVIVPVAGLYVAALELLAVRAGGELPVPPVLSASASAVVLATIYIYFLIGLQFYAALRSALILFLVYAAAAMASYPVVEPAIYEIFVLTFANMIGATVCYTLEKANRTSFLEARLLSETASRDGLTGIYNRRMLDEHLDTVWQQATRDHVPVAVLLVDIDHFKRYNDYFGHQAGDECLRRVAHTLAVSARRPLDFIARYGGEEFAIVLYDARRDYVEELVERIRQNLAAMELRHPASPIRRRVTVSIGAACIVPRADRSRFGLVQLADEALYAAKEGGRDRLVVMDREYETLSTGAFRKAIAAGA